MVTSRTCDGRRQRAGRKSRGRSTSVVAAGDDRAYPLDAANRTGAKLVTTEDEGRACCASRGTGVPSINGGRRVGPISSGQHGGQPSARGRRGASSCPLGARDECDEPVVPRLVRLERDDRDWLRPSAGEAAPPWGPEGALGPPTNVPLGVGGGGAFASSTRPALGGLAKRNSAETAGGADPSPGGTCSTTCSDNSCTALRDSW